MQERDAVDDIVDQWAVARPELNTEAVALIGRLKRLHGYVDAALRGYFADFGIDVSEFDVLATLRRSGEPYQLNARALLAAAMVTSGAITNRVDRLSAKGLVERRPSPTDRRAVLICLTPRGKELIDSMMLGHVANEEELVSPLTPDERVQFDGLLRKLLRSRGDTGFVQRPGAPESGRPPKPSEPTD
jgi:DNA-binding MarR family transcriptional regulator